MDDDTLLLLIGAAAVGLIAWGAWKKSLGKPWNTQTGIQAAEAAGFKTNFSIYTPEATTVQSGGTTFKFREGDWEQLTTAQRILITLDKAVPGTWLSRWALT